MEYKCKMVVRNWINWDGSFKVYIKYKSNNQLFYRRYNIIEYYEWSFKCIYEELERFNDMTMEEIKNNLKKHILNKNKATIDLTNSDKELDNLIKTVKSKQQKFTIKI